MYLNNKYNKIKNNRTIYKYIKGEILIYKSKNGKEHENFNCEAKDKYKNNIECRHLSWFMLLNEKEYHEKLKTLDLISSQNMLKNNHYDSLKIEYQSKYCNIFLLENFGTVIHSIANDLKKKKRKKFLFASENHQMSLIIHYKVDEKNNECYVIKFYDPNETTMHRRAICAKLKNVKNLSITDFLSYTEQHFPKLKSAVLFSPKKRKDTENQIIKYPKKPSNRLLFQGLSYGITELVSTICNQINGIEKHLDTKKILLAAKNDKGTPGLFVALQNGHAKTVKAFTELVLNSTKLDNKDKFELLNTKNSNDVSGLAMALQNGHTKTVKTFTELVLNSTKLDNKEKFELLNANSKGVPGLFMALKNGHAKTVKAFTELVLNSTTLDNKEKFELLNANSEGVPGLAIALQEGHAKTVKVFTKLVLNSTKLDNKEKFELLNANSEGVPGLFVALQNGHAKTVKAFTELVLNSTKLNDKDKFELLNANSEGVPGLTIALQEGHAKTVKAFTELVLNSTKLNDKDKFELLNANSEGVPGSAIALQEGHAKTVKAYIATILNSKLSDTKSTLNSLYQQIISDLNSKIQPENLCKIKHNQCLNKKIKEINSIFDDKLKPYKDSLENLKQQFLMNKKILQKIISFKEKSNTLMQKTLQNAQIEKLEDFKYHINENESEITKDIKSMEDKIKSYKKTINEKANTFFFNSQKEIFGKYTLSQTILQKKSHHIKQHDPQFKKRW
ncbi:MAG: ShET2/EspL2 family type III secretion system effector toxin [Gammaproteobacteria bacterium]|jgi:hypothetical protein